jgi:Undecaprenyl-phosphate glucose phosphotransferase
MLKRHHREFEILQKVLDLAIVNVAWWVAYYLRFESKILSAHEGIFFWYFKHSILLTVIAYYYFRKEGLYGSKRFSPLYQEFFSVIKANSISFIVFIICTYFLSEHKLSRLFIISYYLLSSFLLLSIKISTRKFLRNLRKRGKNVRYALLIGNSEQLHKYGEKITAHPEFGVKIKNWIKDEKEISDLNFSPTDSQRPDIVVIGVANEFAGSVNGLLSKLNNELIETIVLPDLSHSFVGYQIVDISGITAILMNEPTLRSRNVIMKRAVDFIMAALGLMVLAPLLFIIALIIKISSKGPVFYSQIRMGLDGKQFRMFKFRSMRTEPSEHSWTVENDPRITAIGKILRKTSMDELPQLFNVIIGDMSLVGPRPEQPKYVQEFKDQIPAYMLRHKMKAGMTGWAQINGWRGDTSIEKRIECDLYYIKNWSIYMDLWIILMTFWKGFIHKNAY